MLIKEKESDKRCRILETALKLFSHFGFSKTTVNDIADQLSLSSTMIYHYYPDKNSVFEAVLTNLMLDYQAKVNAAIVNATTAEEALYQHLNIRIKTFLQHHKLFSGELTNPAKEAFTPLKTAVDKIENELFIAAIEKGAKTGEFELKMTVKQYADLMQLVFRNLSVTICPPSAIGPIKDTDLYQLKTLQKQVLSQFILALKFKTETPQQNHISYYRSHHN